MQQYKVIKFKIHCYLIMFLSLGPSHPLIKRKSGKELSKVLNISISTNMSLSP